MVSFSLFLRIKEPERKDKMERALTKIEQYNSKSNGSKKTGLAGLDPLPQLDGLSKFL